MEHIIEINHVSKQFEDGKFALQDISLKIGKGEFVTLLGPSGCGKTTLLRCIAGFQPPTSGDILLNGKLVTDVPPNQRPVNTVFQKYALFPHLNVYDNVAFGLKLKHVDEEEISRRVHKALKMVAMSDYEYREVDSLSGGQQQRVAIARAIINRPQVLLLDEPLSALDRKMREEMQLELRDMHKKLGITFIYVTHDQEEALILSDRVVVLREGKIQQIGSPVDIYNEPLNCFVANFIGDSNILDATMVRDRLVHFCGRDFECIDSGFGEGVAVDVVVRPEDFYISDKINVSKQGDVDDVWQLHGVVKSCIFQGVHYDMIVLVNGGEKDVYELEVQDYHAFEVGTEVGLLVRPEDIQVMKKERFYNTFEGVLMEGDRVSFLGGEWQYANKEAGTMRVGEKVRVTVRFADVMLQDDEEDGNICGEVHFILYKGNHYHLQIRSDEGYDLYVDTNDVWDTGDRVGIKIDPEKMIISPVEHPSDDLLKKQG